MSSSKIAYPKNSPGKSTIIVITSDRTPKELHGMEERLVSRFLSGLMVDIQCGFLFLKGKTSKIKGQQNQ